MTKEAADSRGNLTEAATSLYRLTGIRDFTAAVGAAAQRRRPGSGANSTPGLPWCCGIWGLQLLAQGCLMVRSESNTRAAEDKKYWRNGSVCRDVVWCGVCGLAFGVVVGARHNMKCSSLRPQASVVGITATLGQIAETCSFNAFMRTPPWLTLIMTFQFLSPELALEPLTVVALLEKSNNLGNGTIQRYQPEVRALYRDQSSARHGIR